MVYHDHGVGDICHLGHVGDLLLPGGGRHEGRDEPPSHLHLAGRGHVVGRPILPDRVGPTRPLHCPLPAVVGPSERRWPADHAAVVD